MMLAPIAPTERLRGVDIARGIALLGILFVNARFFFGPMGVVAEPSVTLDGGERKAADTLAWCFVETFCTYKFISLFSLLFGFGLAMQAGRAIAQGKSPWPAGLRRLAMLALVGIVHWSLVWFGDILMIYALYGVLALACTRWSQRTVGVVALALAGFVALTGIGMAALAGVSAAMRPDHAAAGFTAAELTARGFSAMTAANFDPTHPAWIEAERAAFAEGPFLDALVFRVVNYAYGFLIAIFSYGWHSLFMMVCGVYAYKAGLFASEGSALRRRIALPALVLGILLCGGGVLALVVLGFDSVGARVAHGVLLSFGAMVLPFGYAAIIIEWSQRLPAFIATPLERTGRMSFTVYLGESILCTALASWWGLAWFGTLDDAQAAIVAAAVWLLLVLFSTAWLAVFRIGPFEWLWRMVTYAGNTGASRPIQA